MKNQYKFKTSNIWRIKTNLKLQNKIELSGGGANGGGGHGVGASQFPDGDFINLFGGSGRKVKMWWRMVCF